MEGPSCRRHIAPEVQAALQSGTPAFTAASPAGDMWSLGSLLASMTDQVLSNIDQGLPGAALHRVPQSGPRWQSATPLHLAACNEAESVQTDLAAMLGVSVVM